MYFKPNTMEFNSNAIYTKSYLTTRELECLRWIIVGKTADEISTICNLSRRTVECYLANAKFKFNCNKLTQLVYLLAKKNLV